MFAISQAEVTPPATYQTSLLASGAPEIPRTLRRLDRLELGRGAWIDWASDWLGGSDHWFHRLATELPWQAASRPMYDRVVDVPRLICNFDGPDTPSEFSHIADLLDAHYGRRFSRMGANWYRDGRDSVAPHADKVPNTGDAIIAIVAVGERRPFVLRPLGGPGPTQRYQFGRGDLLVMGGTTQSYWQHGVPKVSGPAARISLMFRA